MEASNLLATRYAASFPAEAARRLETVASEDVAAFLGDIEPVSAVAVIESMLPPTAAAAFEAMDQEQLSAILERLPVARCVLIMRSVDKTQRATMVGLLPRSNAANVERLLRSSQGSAGLLADPVPVVISPDMSIAEAQLAVEGLKDPYVYVVDPDDRLLGVMHRVELAKSDRQARVGNLMSRQVIRLPADAPQSAVRNHLAWKDFDTLPVVDGSGVLVGVIRHKKIRRSADAPQAEPAPRRAALAAFLDLGEVYWSGLASVITAMAGRPAPEARAEVKHDA